MAAVVVAAGCSTGKEDLSGASSAPSLGVIAHTALSGRPVAIAAGGDAAWVVTRDPARLVSVRRRSGPALSVRTWPLGEGASDVAVAGGSVWVANPQTGTVSEYRDGKRKAKVTLRGAARLAVAGDDLWALTRSLAMVYVDTETGQRVGSPVELPRVMTQPKDLVGTDAGDVWIADASAELVRISRDAFRVDKVVSADVSYMRSLALAAGRVWGAGGPLGDSFGFIDADGNGDYVLRDVKLSADRVVTRPDGGLIIAGGPLAEIGTYGVDGAQGRRLRLGDLGPLAIDDASTTWVTHPTTRRVSALRPTTAPARRRERVQIQETVGTVDGVRLGDRPEQVISRLGEPAPAGSSDALPLQAPEEVTFDFVPDEPFVRYDRYAAQGSPALRYDDAFYYLCRAQSCRGRVGAALVTGPDAVTERGVAVGDSLDRARGRYKLACHPQASDEGAPAEYCTGDVGADREILFIGEPIAVIALRTVR